MSETLSRKADLALTDLTANGGLLLPEQNDVFIKVLMDSPTIIKEMRVQPMNSPKMLINKIGLGNRILHPATQAGSANDDGSNPRYLAAAKRSKPVTSKVELETEEVIAEIRIPYEVLEDNIERGNMADTVLRLIAERAALDLEELVISGDTALSGSDPYLGMMDGVLKRTSSHVVDMANASVNVSMFNRGKKALPKKYRRNLNLLRFYVGADVESDYRVLVASRGSDLGDATLTGNAPLQVLGMPIRPVSLMPEASALLCNPQNLILGIQRNIRIEQDRDIRSREVIIVLTARIAIQIEEEDAVAKVVNIAAAA